MHAWIAFAAAAPESAPLAESLTPAASRPVAAVAPSVATTIDPSPLICLCADMMLTRLTPPKAKELQ